MRWVACLSLLSLVACQDSLTAANPDNQDFMPSVSPIVFSKTVIFGPYTSQERLLTYTTLQRDSLNGEISLKVEVKDSLLEDLLFTSPAKIVVRTGYVKITADTVIVDSVLNMIMSGPAGVISPWFPARKDIPGKLPGFCSMSAPQDSIKCQYFTSSGSTSYRQNGYWKSGVGLTYSEKGLFTPGSSTQEVYRRL
jgi:hypothetical protein